MIKFILSLLRLTAKRKGYECVDIVCLFDDDENKNGYISLRIKHPKYERDIYSLDGCKTWKSTIVKKS